MLPHICDAIIGTVAVGSKLGGINAKTYETHGGNSLCCFNYDILSIFDEENSNKLMPISIFTNNSL